jgi:hypothetical protein
MAADARQEAANRLYGSLMEEAKTRFACVQGALRGSLVLPDALVREIGFLQLRMLCELIALASLIAHGDVRDQTKTLSKEFRADEIIKRLEKLHPDFYPYPVIVEVRNDTNEVILTDQTKPYLTKAELPKLYGRCGDFLHRGTVRKLASSRAPETMLVARKDFDEIARWTNKIVALLNDHRISSIDNKRHLLVLMSAGGVGGQGGRVQVAYAQSP